MIFGLHQMLSIIAQSSLQRGSLRSLEAVRPQPFTYSRAGLGLLSEPEKSVPFDAGGRAPSFLTQAHGFGGEAIFKEISGVETTPFGHCPAPFQRKAGAQAGVLITDNCLSSGR
jgi:hypothetical protein